jgi:hypothetical protein
VSGPIDTYVIRLRTKLIRRFDSDSVERVITEIRDHLQDSAQDLKYHGCPTELAEELAVARFGSVDRTPLIPDLAFHLGAGDRLWGRIGFATAFLTALGLVIYSWTFPADQVISASAAAKVMTPLLLLYGIAYMRAKSLALTTQTIAAVMALIAIVSVLKPEFLPDESVFEKGFSQKFGNAILVADNSAAPRRGSLAPTFSSDSNAGGVAIPGGAPFYGRELPSIESVGKQLPTTAGFSDPATPSPFLSDRGWVPESSRLAAVWLVFLLLTQILVGWLQRTERLEREQNIALLP